MVLPVVGGGLAKEVQEKVASGMPLLTYMKGLGRRDRPRSQAEVD